MSAFGDAFEKATKNFAKNIEEAAHGHREGQRLLAALKREANRAAELHDKACERLHKRD